MGMGPMGPMAPMMGEMTLGAHIGHAHGYGAMGMSMMSHDGAMLGAPMLGPEQIMSDTAAQLISGGLAAPSAAQQGTKEIIHCKSCTLFPPNPNAPPPTTRERPPGCRTIFVGGRTLVHLFRMTLKISAWYGILSLPGRCQLTSLGWKIIVYSQNCVLQVNTHESSFPNAKL